MNMIEIESNGCKSQLSGAQYFYALKCFCQLLQSDLSEFWKHWADTSCFFKNDIPYDSVRNVSHVTVTTSTWP